jgi:hypothetical protein
MKHGVQRNEDGTYEFHWLGNRLSLEEFNEQTLRTARSLKGELEALAQGMDMGSHFDAAKESLAQLRGIEEVLKLPLCSMCRYLIGGLEVR